MNIKKTVALMLALAVILSMSMIFVSADGDSQPRVVDYAELLTDAEVASEIFPLPQAKHFLQTPGRVFEASEREPQ